jgi:GH24 family phage-related lysozyme (muramidase)
MSGDHKKKSANASKSISKEGKAAISKDEGFSAYPYDDQAKHCTVGTGILISMAPCTPEQKATKYDVEKLSKTFHAKLHEAEHYVRHYVRNTNLTQAQYDSLTSFVYNVGVGNAKEALSLANSGKTKAVADEMAKYVNVKVKDKKGKVHLQKSNGLIKRREREKAAFMPAQQQAQH